MRQLDVKEYFRVLPTSALDRLCGIKFVSDNHMPTEQQTTLLM